MIPTVPNAIVENPCNAFDASGKSLAPIARNWEPIWPNLFVSVCNGAGKARIAFS